MYRIILQGGIYFFKLIDTYSSGISLMLIAFFEVIAVAWGYGIYQSRNFSFLQNHFFFHDHRSSSFGEEHWGDDGIASLPVLSHLLVCALSSSDRCEFSEEFWSKPNCYVSQAIMIFNWIQYTPISYGDYEYPDWGIGIGWLLASLSLICIPIGIVKAIWEAEGSNFFQVRSRLLVPNAISFFYTFFIVNHELILSQ